jgi:hypothetical protein
MELYLASNDMEANQTIYLFKPEASKGIAPSFKNSLPEEEAPVKTDRLKLSLFSRSFLKT